MDLSGPHIGTPMIGSKVGNKLGHYFVVLHIRPLRRPRMRTVGTQRSEDQDFLDIEAENDFKDLEPLIYVDIVAQKKDSTEAVKRLIARVRDDHGHMPREVLLRLHSDRGRSSWQWTWSVFVLIMASGGPLLPDTIHRQMVPVRQQWVG